MEVLTSQVEEVLVHLQLIIVGGERNRHSGYLKQLNALYIRCWPEQNNTSKYRPHPASCQSPRLINNNKAPASPFISADNIVNLKINIKKDVFAQNKSTMKSFMTNQEKAQQQLF